MKTIVLETHASAPGLELRDTDQAMQDTVGYADVQTTTGGTR